jgi:hypothetical protein
MRMTPTEQQGTRAEKVNTLERAAAEYQKEVAVSERRRRNGSREVERRPSLWGSPALSEPIGGRGETFGAGAGTRFALGNAGGRRLL